MSTQEKPPREIYVRQEDFSNRALIREPGEKWPDDVKGEPGSAWTKFIEYAAYESLRRERDELRRQKENEYQHWKSTKQELTKYEEHHLECHKKWEAERDALRAENERLRADNERHMNIDYWYERHKIVAEENAKLKELLAEVERAKALVERGEG